MKNRTTAQYVRIYPQTWQNHIALQVALYKEDVKSKRVKKKGEKTRKSTPLISDRPVYTNNGRKMNLKKEDISDPMYPSSDCLKTEVTNVKGL